CPPRLKSGSPRSAYSLRNRWKATRVFHLPWQTTAPFSLWPRTRHAKEPAPPGAMNAAHSRLPPGIDHIHLTMTRWRTSMADRIRLRRLSLPVAERSTKLVAARTADHVHRVPEFRCTHLVGHV